MTDVVEENLARKIATALEFAPQRVQNTLDLLDEGNTVPFITRYRKERTGGLDEEQLRAIQSLAAEYREVAERTEKILKTIEEQGKLTDQLRKEIANAGSLKRLEELYAPFKKSRKTRADEAREMGLTPLATAIASGKLKQESLSAVAESCVGKHPSLTSAEVVLSGAADIIAEDIAMRVDARDFVRNTALKTGTLESKLIAKAKDKETYKDYADFKESVTKAPPHRILAMDRGEAKKALRVHIRWDLDLAQMRVAGLLQLKDHAARDFMMECVTDALKRMVNPSIERELRRDLSDRAQAHAIDVFCRNLRALLLQPPLAHQRVLAIDPAYRTGCKIVALDEDGNVLGNDLIYVTKKKELEETRKKLAELLTTHNADVIAIGNGTASRETESLVAETIREHDLKCKYIVVNEAGASVYSASEAGRNEFPDIDATVRGTISIGRRLQDPLSELVKIEPQHIGVGMYQHDLSEKRLGESLDAVVESCVNNVGVDLNRASVELLKHVSGLNRSIASKIVAWRKNNGPFVRREQLQEVSGVGPATFTQAAGFLRIPDGDNPLDRTWIHPESYDIATRMLTKLEYNVDVLKEALPGELIEKLNSSAVDEMASNLKTDSFTTSQVLESLLKPGRDPREELPGPVFRSEVLKFEDLQVGMKLAGVVSNVVDFGAFADVGLKSDGLIHVSRMSDTFISSPYERVSVGDVVAVWVESIDQERQRVGLSLLAPTESK